MSRKLEAEPDMMVAEIARLRESGALLAGGATSSRSSPGLPKSLRPAEVAAFGS
ncbi:MAG: hypothetical protein R3F31_24775 [Verrucomicrobiales bacterium]